MAATVRQVNGPNGRFYEVDGELFPSVTHILTAINKPALVPWAARQERQAVSEAAAALYGELAAAGSRYPASWFASALAAKLGTVKAHQRTLEREGDIGGQAHRAIEWLLRTALGAAAGPKPAISAPALIAVQAFKAWALRVSLKPVLVERIVYSKKHRYAGTLDLLARVEGRLTMIDFKTGKAVYDEAHLQAAAYAAALEEMGYREPAASLIVRLPKVAGDPPVEVVPVPPRAALLPVFLATRQLWEWTYANDQAFKARTRKRPAATAAPDLEDDRGPLPTVREIPIPFAARAAR
jgi:genome maintenance exonuclease 1